MTNIEKYDGAFIEVFAVDKAILNDNFSKESVDSWDSVRQLSVITALEDIFDILFDPEDIIALTSYKIGKNILAKYEIFL